MRASLFRTVLACVLTTGCGHAMGMCLGFVPDSTEKDPLTAEVRHAFDNSAAVFVGVVTAMGYEPAQTSRGDGEVLVVRMVANRWWKGEGRREVRLLTGNYRFPDGTGLELSEEHDYQAGRTYLVFAAAGRGGLHANACTRTKPIDGAAAEVAILDGLAAERAPR